jgi:hypothetical protein
MYIKEFEKELQEQISPKLNIVRTAPDIAGVYYDRNYIGVSLPPDFVFDCVNPKYTDNPPWWSGQRERVIFRSRPLLKHFISMKLKHILK